MSYGDILARNSADVKFGDAQMTWSGIDRNAQKPGFPQKTRFLIHSVSLPPGNRTAKTNCNIVAVTGMQARIGIDGAAVSGPQTDRAVITP